MQLYRKPNITRKKVIITTLILVILMILWWFGNRWLTVSEFEFSSPKIPEGADGLKIVQISDLHNARFGKDNSRLMAKIRECDPDIIVITGDIADDVFTDIDIAVNFCRQAAELCPTYYVTGNHEYGMESALFSELLQGIRDSGAVYLNDEAVIFGTGENGFAIIGLNDESFDCGNLSKIKQTLPKDMFTLVLAHEPQNFEDYSACEPDLIFSGHAHGGLIRLPFIGGLVAPDQGLLPKYTAGRYDCGKSTMFVSRGLGNSGATQRLLDSPEILCVTLKKG